MSNHQEKKNKKRIREWKWVEGVVDTQDEYMELSYGDVWNAEKPQPIARIGKPKNHVFPVQWLVSPLSEEHEKMIKATKNQLDYFLIELGEKDPWLYAKYHCGTCSNVYSKVHWSYYNKDEALSGKPTESVSPPIDTRDSPSEHKKIIRFSRAKQEQEQYRLTLEEIKHDIARMSEELRSHCMNLAVMKVWKKWDEELPEDALAVLNDQSFLECGDENVVKLMEIVLLMEDFCGDVLS